MSKESTENRRKVSLSSSSIDHNDALEFLREISSKLKDGDKEAYDKFNQEFKVAAQNLEDALDKIGENKKWKQDDDNVVSEMKNVKARIIDWYWKNEYNIN